MYSQFLNRPVFGHNDIIIWSFDEPWSLCPVVASLRFTGNCVILHDHLISNAERWYDHTLTLTVLVFGLSFNLLVELIAERCLEVLCICFSRSADLEFLIHLWVYVQAFLVPSQISSWLLFWQRIHILFIWHLLCILFRPFYYNTFCICGLGHYLSASWIQGDTIRHFLWVWHPLETRCRSCKSCELRCTGIDQGRHAYDHISHCHLHMRLKFSVWWRCLLSSSSYLCSECLPQSLWCVLVAFLVCQMVDMCLQHEYWSLVSEYYHSPWL